jgi:hypothetical protein
MRWSAKFREPLVLNDGTKLATLRQAGQHLVTHYAAVTRDAALAEAMTLLMAAAETGEAAPVADAREQLQLFLSSQRAVGREPLDIQERLRQQLARGKRAASPAAAAVRKRRG